MWNKCRGLYLTQQIRVCEQQALQEPGLSEDALMLRAGTAALASLKNLYPDVRSIAVFCGGGNNAGDGYVLARLALEQGFQVVVYPYRPLDDLSGAAKQAALAALRSGVYLHALDDSIDSEVELLVDALLGIGLQHMVRGSMIQAIHLINDSHLPVLALDVPSGLDANTGRVLGLAVQADITLTFIADKLGLYMLDGPDHAGKVVCHSLQLDAYVQSLKPAVFAMDERPFSLGPRLRNSHKGMFGRILVVGSGPGMPGAVHLTAHAALRVGAGLIQVATWPEYAGQALPLLPEVMLEGIDDVDDLMPLLAKADVCVLGPGLGESKWAERLFKSVVSAQLPLVMDASALRILAKHPQHDDNWVLTPHPGEAASLLACTVDEIQADRCRAAQKIQQRYGGCVVLKGLGSIIVGADEADAYLCPLGNPGMATAGMGDVLSGVIAALLAQGVGLNEAAKFGVYLHAKAADDAVLTQGERGLMASDLMSHLRRQVNK